MDDFVMALLLAALMLAGTAAAGILVFALSLAIYHNPVVALWAGGALVLWLALAIGIWWWDKL